jgi:riboflavin kinase/FMN adenylyltransferase
MSIKFKGPVIKGKGLGRKLGFPTINIVFKTEKTGVFAGEVLIDGKWLPAAIHIGKRISTDNKYSCEAYIIGWSGGIDEGTVIQMKLGEKIRDVLKFNSLDDLKVQIAKDVEFTKNWYNLT